ncbi:MAG: cytochrome c maturation protein CcmE [Acidobacteria bacterium]|nr:cytochrome c maturation protein CcmE [Acidobacteriota bacterium]
MNATLKFGLITAVIVGALAWLAVDGIGEAATYYVTIDELHALDARPERIRVGGDVVPGSIVKSGDRVEFVIQQVEEGVEPKTLNVVYTGQDPLPDTFRDRAQALCDGKLRADGAFEANKIQAKCASKYEAKPGENASPSYQAAPAADSAT